MWRLAGWRRRPRPALGFRDASTAAMASRAVVLPRFGGPEVLEVRPAVEVPDLKPREVLVRARAVSINPLDLRMRSGYGRSIFEPLLPLILGRDISGEVAAVGSSVSALTIGQEVFGALHPTAVRGTYADYAILSEDELTIKPSSVTHVEASAIPFAALTAWRALKSTARITQGQRLLVLGGGGAVGLAAIQLSVAAGCSVSTTCGSKSIDRVLEAGAEKAVDYTAEDVESEIKEQFDVVLDTIGIPETERIGINLLKKGGHYMTLQGEAASLADRYGLAIGLPAATAILLKKQMQYRYSHGIGRFFKTQYAQIPSFSWVPVWYVLQQLAVYNGPYNGFFAANLAYHAGCWWNFPIGDLLGADASSLAKYWWTYMRADVEGLDEIRRLLETGKLKIPVEKTFPITQVREAHEVKERRLVPGKVVLEID